MKAVILKQVLLPMERVARVLVGLKDGWSLSRVLRENVYSIGNEILAVQLRLSH
jgi:hypothetical protein